MVPTSLSRIRTFFRPRTRALLHPDVVSEASLNLPRRIDNPVSAARLARDLLRNHREDITLVLHMDERHRLVGSAIVAVGWVQATRLSARPILFGALSCQASAAVLVRHGRCRSRRASEAEDRSYVSLAAACSRSGLQIADHVIVAG